MWSEWEKAQAEATKPKVSEALTCPKCNNSWLQLIEVNRYKTRQVSVLQDPVKVYPTGAPVLICAKCGSVVRYNIQASTTADGRLYNEMLEEIAKPKEE